ncbi:helix-turn-helix domain-containing protein [Falsihalocynthiibacter sp. SS001]|uniref:helix-turn-helix domain-containing protein n=1 Tax=Falsihalocynthiibacter sp. SS001 TaxID=3349698 RepID=UPI0036D26849
MAQDSGASHRPVDVLLDNKDVTRVRTPQVDIEIVNRVASQESGLSWRLSKFTTHGPKEVEVQGIRAADFVFTQVPLMGTFDAQLACGTSFNSGSVGLVRPTSANALFKFEQSENQMFGAMIPLASIQDWFGENVPLGMRKMLDDSSLQAFHRGLPPPVFLKQLLSHALQNKTPLRRLLLDGVALQILGYHLDKLDWGKHRGPTLAEQRCARDARAIMKANAMSPMSIAEIAGTLKISARRLEIAHKELFGSSLHQSMIQLRLEAACDALRAGEPIKSVAHRMGYSSASNFSYAFRRQIGLPPRAWLDSQMNTAQIRLIDPKD